MNEVNAEFYKALASRLNAADPEDRERVFAEVHAEYDINPEEAHQQNLQSWAVRMQCTPEDMLEQIDNTSFSPTINIYEHQALLIALSPRGRELIGAPDLPLLATYFMSDYNDDMIEIADGYAKAAEGAEEADDE